MSVIDHHLGFVNALREAGVPVSVVESLDAVNALKELDVLDRETVRAAYSATLVKRAAHRDVFRLLFDLWFPTTVGSDATPVQASTLPPALDPRVKELRAELFAFLLQGDDVEIRRVARDFVAEYGMPQGARNWSMRRVFDTASTSTMIGPLVQAQVGGGIADPIDEQGYRQLFLERVKGFEEAVEIDVRRRNAEMSGVEQAAASAMRPPLEELDFTAISMHDLAELRREVQRLARKFAARIKYKQRRQHRGRLDFRRTMRGSLATGGTPIRLHLAPPRVSRPDLVVLADASQSVRSFMRFTLMFLFALQEQFSRVRAFAFIDTVDDITRFFENSNDMTQAATKLVQEANLVEDFGSTDYGKVFTQFRERYPDAINHRTMVLILGDGRGNYRDLGLPVLDWIRKRARSFYWLNPEPSATWGTGDSEAGTISQHVTMVECRNLVQLSEFIERIT